MRHACFCIMMCIVLVPGASAQGLEDVFKALDVKGSVDLQGTGVTIARADFVAGSDSVEAISFRPTAPGRYPAILIIPGFSRSARDYVPFGVRLSAQGFACLAVTMPGFGRSAGTPDFCGPRTIAALETALVRFRKEAFVDSARMGVYGYSRGALAAATLAVRDNPLRAGVLASGIYDLARAHADLKDEGILLNIKNETGLSESALKERSPLLAMEHLTCPVLILHGEKDQNAPVNQAQLLRDRLTELKKPFEIKLFPEAGHDLGMSNVLESTLDFMKRNLRPS
ncbi:MAG TPA: alpha/beta fold hydrolase [Candidatus Eisenbacteria bacterium]|nr:alpha/beta fold hydrolase [Candidatus Eisenbacteria bacterium]